MSLNQTSSRWCGVSPRNILFCIIIYGVLANVPEVHHQWKFRTNPESQNGTNAPSVWSEAQIVTHMEANPNRAYFTRLFRDGGFRRGIEVGVADGRFSEHFLKDLKSISNFEWTMVEPFPNENLKRRYSPTTGEGTWSKEGLLQGVKHVFHTKMSLDNSLLDQLPDESYDFIYLDGDHSYNGVKKEIPLFWKKVKKGGVLAGHDYCNYGEKNLPCMGCNAVPKCIEYTEFGVAHGKPKGTRVANQNGVVKAVQEWMMEVNNQRLRLHQTKENFSRESLAKDGMDYDLVITNTRNPSWFIVKPT